MLVCIVGINEMMPCRHMRWGIRGKKPMRIIKRK
jgi:hypothetical protein